MKKNAMFKKLTKDEKWEIEKERQALIDQQRRIRLDTDRLKDSLIKLQDDMNAAILDNNGIDITILQNQIDMIRDKISENDRRYSANKDALETYSKVMKNDKEGNASKLSSICTSIISFVGILGGMAMGYIGLSGAYRADEEGSLINKNTLSWASKMPIFKMFIK